MTDLTFQQDMKENNHLIRNPPHLRLTVDTLYSLMRSLTCSPYDPHN